MNQINLQLKLISMNLLKKLEKALMEKYTQLNRF